MLYMLYDAFLYLYAMSIVVRVRAMDYAKQYENDWNNFEVKTSKFLIRPYRDDFALSLSLSLC